MNKKRNYNELEEQQGIFIPIVLTVVVKGVMGPEGNRISQKRVTVYHKRGVTVYHKRG